jgi:hypothetical protein
MASGYNMTNGQDLDTIFELVSEAKGSYTKRVDYKYEVNGSDISNRYIEVNQGYAVTSISSTGLKRQGIYDVVTSYAAKGSVVQKEQHPRFNDEVERAHYTSESATGVYHTFSFPLNLYGVSNVPAHYPISSYSVVASDNVSNISISGSTLTFRVYVGGKNSDNGGFITALGSVTVRARNNIGKYSNSPLNVWNYKTFKAEGSHRNDGAGFGGSTGR